MEQPFLSSKKEAQNAMPIDPASGRFIVADILPPQNRLHAAARTTAARRVPAKPAIKKPAAKPSPPARAPASAPAPKKKPKDTQVLDEWFRKERAARTEKKPGFAPPVRVSKKKYIYLVSAAMVVLAGGYGLSYYLATMRIFITLQSQAAEVAEPLQIATDPAAGADVPGELLTLAQTGTETFSVSGTDDVRAKARGTITVYNAFNSKPQVLVATTRFETPDGSIYRIRESVRVPAAVVTGGVLTPSSVDVMVWADQPGENYNQEDLVDFTIPGFKGTPRYDGFYASAKTPMEGGFIGTAPVVTRQDRDNAEERLLQGVRSQAAEDIMKAVPEGFTLLADASEITVADKSCNAEVGDAADEFMCSVSMEARALVFREDDVTRVLAERAGLGEADVRIDNWEEISFQVETRSVENGTLAITATGSALFVWELAADLLVSDIAGISDPRELSGVFKQYDAIDRADVEFTPRWMRSIPKNPERIVIETRY